MPTAVLSGTGETMSACPEASISKSVGALAEGLVDGEDLGGEVAAAAGGDVAGADDDEVAGEVAVDVADEHGAGQRGGRQRLLRGEYGVLAEREDEAADGVVADDGEVGVEVAVEVASGEGQGVAWLADAEAAGEGEVAGAVVEGDLDLGDARLGGGEVEVTVVVEVDEQEGAGGYVEVPLGDDEAELRAGWELQRDHGDAHEAVADLVRAALVVLVAVWGGLAAKALHVRSRGRGIFAAAADALFAHALVAVAAVGAVAVARLLALGRRGGVGGRAGGAAIGGVAIGGVAIGAGPDAGAIGGRGGVGLAGGLRGDGAAGGDEGEEAEVVA
jgi:hypothetical protein